MPTHILLFGAGASKDAGLPDTTELTVRIVDVLNTAAENPESKAVNFVLGALLFGEGIRGSSPIGQRVDVEAVSRALSWLAAHRTSEVLPFVNAWHPRIAELEAVRDDIWDYANRRLTLALASILWVPDPHTDYLQPLARLLRVQPRVVIASLNYDNIVERFCATHQVECSTGFNRDPGYNAARPYEFHFADAGVILLKLHGSLNWALYHPGSSAEGFCSHPFVISWPRVPDFDGVHIVPALLFGGENKLTASGPYLQLLMKFADELKHCDQLTVIGYSFRDPHVNQQIASYMSASTSNHVTVIDPKPPVENAFFQSMRAAGANRLHIMETTAAEGLGQIIT